MAVTPSSEFKQ